MPEAPPAPRSTHPRAPLVGRQPEIAALEEALSEARQARGGIVLLRGEAGVGKTRLVTELMERHDDVLVLEGFCRPGKLGIPYLPLAQALRAGRGTTSAALTYPDPPGSHLALLLPELGPPPDVNDPEMLVEAVRMALRDLSRTGPCVAFLDDLHWADHATLELLTALARWLEREQVLVIGAYRDEQIPRGHGLRLARAELRRMGMLRELRVTRLDGEETAALVAAILGPEPAASLAGAIHERAEGLPFFVEEIAHARARELEAAEPRSADSLPIPETVSDAVLAQARLLSEAGHEALSYAAAMGVQLDLDAMCDLGTSMGVEELASAGFIETEGDQRARFRHALVRDAVYRSLSWPHRREHHHRIAERFAGDSHPPQLIAEQWLLAGDPGRARPHLLAAANAHCGLHAYQDAALAFEAALESWPEEENPGRRAETFERLGRCAQLAGDTERAIGALGRALAVYGEGIDLARVHRALAGLHELRGDWDLAIAARHEAAAYLTASGLSAEAAAERLAAASHLQQAGELDGALRAVAGATRSLEDGRRVDLRARALALEGQIRAKLGEGSAGVERAREGLALALSEDLIGDAADAYYRLADALEHATDYRPALQAWEAGVEYCKARDISDAAQVCLACMTPVMRQIGEWDRAIEVCREVVGSHESPIEARMVAAGELGLIQSARGTRKGTRARLSEAFAFATEIELFGLEVDSAYGLARLDGLEGRPDRAADRLIRLMERCRDRQEAHYSVSALRWSATFFSLRGDRAQVGACTELLAQSAETAATGETTAGMAHALAEAALLGEDLERAVIHFERALEAVVALTLPLDSAEIGLRAGIALMRAGERERAVERLVTAYRTAKKLGARPLASTIVAELAGLGEKAELRLGRRAQDDLGQAGLSRRELEVVRLVAQGRTNREVAGELFLSPRTVDTHLRNLLFKLDCGSRTEAVKRAAELGLV